MIHVTITTPQRTVYDGTMDAISVPTKDGEVTIYGNHVPLTSTLKVGELRFHKDNEVIAHASTGGVMQVQPDSKVFILADDIEHAKSIDIEAAQAAYDRAKKLIDSQEYEDEVEFAHFEAMLEKSLNQLSVAKKWR